MLIVLLKDWERLKVTMSEKHNDIESDPSQYMKKAEEEAVLCV